MNPLKSLGVSALFVLSALSMALFTPGLVEDAAAAPQDCLGDGSPMSVIENVSSPECEDSLSIVTDSAGEVGNITAFLLGGAECETADQSDPDGFNATFCDAVSNLDVVTGNTGEVGNITAFLIGGADCDTADQSNPEGFNATFCDAVSNLDVVTGNTGEVGNITAFLIGGADCETADQSNPEGFNATFCDAVSNLDVVTGNTGEVGNITAFLADGADCDTADQSDPDGFNATFCGVVSNLDVVTGNTGEVGNITAFLADGADCDTADQSNPMGFNATFCTAASELDAVLENETLASVIANVTGLTNCVPDVEAATCTLAALLDAALDEVATVEDIVNSVGNEAITMVCEGDDGTLMFCPPPAPHDPTPPVVSLTADDNTVAPLATVTFTLGAYDDDGVNNWTLLFGDGSSKSGSGFVNHTETHQYTSTGSFQAKLTVHDTYSANPAQSTSTTTIAVSGLPIDYPIVTKFDATPSSGAGPLDVEFKVNATDNGTIEHWSLEFGDGANETSNSTALANGTLYTFTHTYEEVGSYTAYLNLTDDQGQTRSATLAIDVAAAAFSINATTGSLVVVEDGAKVSYGINISKALAAGETVAVDLSYSPALNVSMGGQNLTRLTFNSTTWSTGFTVNVTAISDADGDSLLGAKIVHLFNTSDSNVAGPVKVATVLVNIQDDEAGAWDKDGDGLVNSADPDANDPDTDDDGDLDGADNCPVNANANQLDTDHDGKGDVCDLDDDADGVADTSDAFPLDATETVDTDGDGIGNNADTDDDGDGILDAADTQPLDNATAGDPDGDGIDSVTDNCPLVANAMQLDFDGDGEGDDCDLDADDDGVLNATDAFPLNATETLDTDGDGIGNNADTDDDGDGLLDVDEIANGTAPLLKDTDGDGLPDNVELELGTDPGNATTLSLIKDITVKMVDGIPTLSWSIEDSDLIDAFIVWRFSSPTNIATVDYVDGVTDYTFEDEDFPGGMHYYAVQVVFDGEAGDYSTDISLLSGVVLEDGFLEETCPADAVDTDADGLCDALEDMLGTDKNLTDTDGDGFNDGAEVLDRNSNPLAANSVGSLPKTTDWYQEAWFWVGLLLTLAILGVMVYGIVLYASRPADA